MTMHFDTSSAPVPHGGGRVLTAGDAAERAQAAVIYLHGRGADAADILGLHRVLHAPGLCAIAPQAAGNSWYPQSFLAPEEINREGVASAHGVIERLIEQLSDAGIPPRRVALVGFSQGACLATDHAAKFPRRYGAIAALTGGLIGPPDARFEFAGSLDGTPVFLGAGDPDPHIPWGRVEESARVLEAMDAGVTLKRYPGLPHMVSGDQIEETRSLLLGMLTGGAG